MQRPLSALLLLAVTACSKSSSNGGTGPGPNGSLDVTITAPAGVTGKVTIITPTDSLITITSSQTLNGLAPGNYIVRASAGVTVDPIVSTGYTGAVTGSPASVVAGQTAAATVTYSAARPGAGVLWVASQLGNTMSGFSSAQLATTGAPAPAVVLGSGGPASNMQNELSIAVDSSGGIWWVEDTDTLRYYSASQVAGSGNPAPARKLVSASLTTARAVAFDPKGNLWVADQAHSNLNEFTAAQLAAGGAQTATVVISPVFGSIKRPWAIAFDKKGDLWVANYGDSSIAGFSPAQLATSGAPVPFAGISGSKGTANAIGIAFDPAGNLWVATFADTISKFTPDQLTSIGAPTPSVILKMPAGTFSIPIAFDNSGDLWVCAYIHNKLYMFTPAQLTATGSPTPAVTISATGSSISSVNAMAFSPPASNLPIP